VCPVDWEGLAYGAGAFDLAAMAVGWPDDEREAIAMAYFDAQRHSGWYASPRQLLEAIDLCHPPPEHRQDWLGEALDKALRLGFIPEESD
jgi:hypothetical protein